MDTTGQFDQLEDVMALYFVYLSTEVTPEARRFAENLCRGVVEHLYALDEVIERSSNNWKLERMSRVDRNILRLASYELTHRPDTPPRVVINEAIEIGKYLGSSESGSFINGVLNRVLSELDQHRQ
jgi:N utilization substance protein B